MPSFHKLLGKYNIDYTPLLESALSLAYESHITQWRQSGEAYIHHIFRVVQLLSECKLPEYVLIAAALHDVPEDTQATTTEIADTYGETIGFMVYAVTKTQLYKKNLETLERDRMRIALLYANRLHIAIVANPAILFIKLSDQIDNISTLKYCSFEKQQRKLQEVVEVFMPMYAQCEKLLEDEQCTFYAQLIQHLESVIVIEQARINTSQ